eukprot:685903-Rhodomonas_salina.2
MELKSAIVLRACYAIRSTYIPYAATRPSAATPPLRTRSSGSDPLSAYARSMQCPVLTSRASYDNTRARRFRCGVQY